jgi:hypothetical protein
MSNNNTDLQSNSQTMSNPKTGERTAVFRFPYPIFAYLTVFKQSNSNDKSNGDSPNYGTHQSESMPNSLVASAQKPLNLNELHVSGSISTDQDVYLTDSFRTYRRKPFHYRTILFMLGLRHSRVMTLGSIYWYHCVLKKTVMRNSCSSISMSYYGGYCG